MNKKILIIEDDAPLATALAERLKADGFEIFLAVDGETGFRMVEEKMPDLLLLDLVLPRKHGFQILEELKARSELKNIPVMVITNLESGQDIERALAYGVKAYLVKANYSLDEVAKKVKQIIS